MPTTHERFRAAIEAQDIDAAIALLAPDVVFHSPAVHHPYVGAEAVGGLLRCISEVLEDFTYTDELTDSTNVEALIFRARAGDREVEGLDLLRLDDEGQIIDFTVMIRPLSGLIAVVERMAPKVEARGIKPTRS